MKKILNWFFIVLGVSAFIFGFITNFLPIEGSKDMSRMGIEWYQFTHYWYIWVTMLVSLGGYYLTAKK